MPRVRLSVDDLLLVHQASVSDLGHPLEDMGSGALARLERILELGEISFSDDAVGLAAYVAVQLAMHALFPIGNYRTAVLAAAVIVDLAGCKLPPDWAELADLLLAFRRSGLGPGRVSEKVESWLRQQRCGSGA